ncbi:MAG TPA: Uma2 family endonuclease [Lacipirellulaceae bacterium]|jgi:Uma2 family endonuclease
MSITQETAAAFPEFLPLRRFSTFDYLQMIEAGVLGRRDRLELIGGMIVEMSPAGIPNNHILIRIIELFGPLLGRFQFIVQGTLTVADGQVFDPDFTLLRRREDGYKTKLPGAADVLLVIEAAESSLRRDQQIKLPVYANAGIAEYWIADLDRETLIVHRDPDGNKYRGTKSFSGDDLVSPLACPEFSFAVRKLFD